MNDMKSTGWKFETCDGESGFELKAKGGSRAIADLERIMNNAEKRMKEDSKHNENENTTL